MVSDVIVAWLVTSYYHEPCHNINGEVSVEKIVASWCERVGRVVRVVAQDNGVA